MSKIDESAFHKRSLFCKARSSDTLYPLRLAVSVIL